VSFGPKLDSLPEVPPNGSITAVLHFVPPDDAVWTQEGFIYVEDLHGMKTLKIEVHCTLRERNDDCHE
jgi:hypothetical protein